VIKGFETLLTVEHAHDEIGLKPASDRHPDGRGEIGEPNELEPVEQCRTAGAEIEVLVEDRPEDKTERRAGRYEIPTELHDEDRGNPGGPGRL